MEYKTLREFWPFYLGEHSKPWNRVLHFVGSFLGLVWFGSAIFFMNPWFVLAGFVNGYAFAWIGHFFIEKNRPATFQYPLKSFLSDWILFYYILTGKIHRELKKYSLGETK